MAETFLAYSREINRGHFGEIKLEAAILPDIAGEIDARNNWTEPTDVPTNHEIALEIAKQQSARAVNEMLRYVFSDVQLGKRGHLRRALIRFMGIANHLAPDLLSHGWDRPAKRHVDPLTTREVAALHDLRCAPAELRAAAREFRKAWPFRVIVAPRSKARQ